MKYRCLIADPPWEFSQKWKRTKEGQVARGAGEHYDLLTIEDLIEMGPLVRDVAEDASILALWCPSSLPDQGLRVMAAWGFVQKQIWTWMKMGPGGRAFGLGKLARGCTEHAFVGVRGGIYEHLKDRSQRTGFMAPALAHSQKPVNVHQMLDTMFPEGGRLEMFARRAYPSWTTIGNEDPSTPGEDIRDALKRLKEKP